MLSEIALEAFRFFDRPKLEGLQMHSRYFRDLVNRHARTLPLRYIHDVNSYSAGSFFRLAEDDGPDETVVVAPSELELLETSYDPSLPRPWLELPFHRVNNAFIHQLRLAFRRADLPQLNYLRTNANDLQCRVKAVRIAETQWLEIDYALVDFLGAHLKPEIYETSMIGSSPKLEEDYVMLFTHNAWRGNVKHVFSGKSPPDCLIPELFGVDVVETCAMTTLSDPRPWIGKFVEMFKTTERGTGIVRSVTLLHAPLRDGPPLRNAVDLLGQPRRTDVAPPHSAFIEERLEGLVVTESTVADLFVFETAKSSRRLEVFMWTYASVICLDHAYLLQVLDI